MASRYGLSCQGADKIALTKLDVLSSMKEIPVITGYKLDGVEVPRFDPLSDLDRVQPVVTLLPGWNKDISGCKSWDDAAQGRKAVCGVSGKAAGSRDPVHLHRCRAREVRAERRMAVRHFIEPNSFSLD